MRTVRRVLVSVVFLLWAAGTVLAQTAEVIHNVNLRHDPSTDHPAIRLLHPPEQIQLLEPGKTGGYFHVQTSLGETGWVWSPNVQVLVATPTPTPTSTPVSTATPTPLPFTATATPTPTPAGPATAIDETWDKPAPVEISYTTTHGTRAGGGKPGSDAATNLRKNRVDTPTSYHLVTWDAIATLPFPTDDPSRVHWTPEHLAEIARFEGVAVTVVGFLSHDVKEEDSETCNCSYTNPDKATEVDWHMYLTKLSARPISEAMIVEATPRVKKDRLWNRTKLLQWKDSPNQVRISGWVFIDQQHANVIGNDRATIWEIHPVTKIEVWQGGTWVDLETLQ